MEHPTIHDKVFLGTDGLEYDYASINRKRGIRNENGLFYMIEGYRNASFRLLEELIEEHDESWLKIDSWIYPVLFTFRHYLELLMKDTLRNHRMIKREVYADQIGFVNEHSLLVLWQELKPYLVDTYSHQEGLDETIQAVENLITEIDEKDKGSYSFRYPFDSSRKNTADIKFSLTHISVDLLNLQRVFKKLAYYFDGINEHSLVILDQTSESD